MKGISLAAAEVEMAGFALDRRWMLIDENNRFISQREFPKMSLISIDFDSGGLSVNLEGSSILIPYKVAGSGRVEAEVWGTWIDCLLVGEKWDIYFSNLLSKEVRLVQMDEKSVRSKELKIAPHATEVSFADGYPYLILGTKSVELLNSKLDVPLSWNRFRPNLLIDTNVAHEEDKWKKIRIGEVVFQMIKPCVRCNVITINQETADISKEPLRTLATYRREEQGVIFAVNAIALNTGEINLDDDIEILEAD